MPEGLPEPRTGSVPRTHQAYLPRQVGAYERFQRLTPLKLQEWEDIAYYLDPRRPDMKQLLASTSPDPPLDIREAQYRERSWGVWRTGDFVLAGSQLQSRRIYVAFAQLTGGFHLSVQWSAEFPAEDPLELVHLGQQLLDSLPVEPPPGATRPRPFDDADTPHWDTARFPDKLEGQLLVQPNLEPNGLSRTVRYRDDRGTELVCTLSSEMLMTTRADLAYARRREAELFLIERGVCYQRDGRWIAERVVTWGTLRVESASRDAGAFAEKLARALR